MLEYKDTKVVYRRYASLFFITGIGAADNELITLEIIHRYVEVRRPARHSRSLLQVLDRSGAAGSATSDHAQILRQCLRA